MQIFPLGIAWGNKLGYVWSIDPFQLAGNLHQVGLGAYANLHQPLVGTQERLLEQAGHGGVDHRYLMAGRGGGDGRDRAGAQGWWE